MHILPRISIWHHALHCTTLDMLHICLPYYYNKPTQTLHSVFSVQTRFSTQIHFLQRNKLGPFQTEIAHLNNATQRSHSKLLDVIIYFDI